MPMVVRRMRCGRYLAVGLGQPGSDFAESSLHLENSKCRLLFKGFNVPKQPAPVFAVSPRVQAAFGAIILFRQIVTRQYCCRRMGFLPVLCFRSLHHFYGFGVMHLN